MVKAKNIWTHITTICCHQTKWIKINVENDYFADRLEIFYGWIGCKKSTKVEIIFYRWSRVPNIWSIYNTTYYVLFDQVHK